MGVLAGCASLTESKCCVKMKCKRNKQIFSKIFPSATRCSFQPASYDGFCLTAHDQSAGGNAGYAASVVTKTETKGCIFSSDLPLTPAISISRPAEEAPFTAAGKERTMIYLSVQRAQCKAVSQELEHQSQLAPFHVTEWPQSTKGCTGCPGGGVWARSGNIYPAFPQALPHSTPVGSAAAQAVTAVFK